MIVTKRNPAPWPWVGLMAVPFGTLQYIEFCSTQAMALKLREMGVEPFFLTMILSLNVFFNIAVGASVNYLSDRVWTHMGRRRPFAIAGFSVVALGLAFLPFIDSLPFLIGFLVVYELVRDVTTTYEPLAYEVVPPQQRGRFNALVKFSRQIFIMFFFGFAIAQWDVTYALPRGMIISGKVLLFWIGSLLAIANIVFLKFFVREVKPAELPSAAALKESKLRTIGTFFKNVFGTKQWWPVYGIGLAQMVFWLGLGNLTPLLYTEQFGYSKEFFGRLLAIMTPVGLVLFVPLGGWLADRVDRRVFFKWFALMTCITHLLWFLYLKMVAPGGVPPLYALVIQGVTQAGIQTVGALISVSLIFDYIPRSLMGTVSAGIGILRGIARMVVDNGIGLIVTVFAITVNGVPTYDYTLGYLYLFVLGLIATVFAFWFHEQDKAGKIQRLGLIEAEEDTSNAEGEGND